MKTGRTLAEFAAEIERQATAKRDFVADTRELTMLNGTELSVTGQGEFPVRPMAHDQIGTFLDIPAKYYDRIAVSHPTLLDQNVNTLLRANPKTRLVRTLDGNIRAFLSDRYRRIDNEDLANAVFPILAEIPDVQFPSVEITETNLYIKAVAPRITGEVKRGDIVQAGVVIINSEVGKGSFGVDGLAYRLSCLNGAITGDSFRRHHLGSRISGEDAAYELFKDETLRADDRAFWLKVRDLVTATVSETRFRVIIEKMQFAANETPTMTDPSAGVKELAKRFSFSDGEEKSVLRHLTLGGDLSMYGAMNAVTRAAQDVESYDRSVEMESVGGAILDLAPKEWAMVAVR